VINFSTNRKIRKILVNFLLIFYVISSSFALAHSFSHQSSNAAEVRNKEYQSKDSSSRNGFFLKALSSHISKEKNEGKKSAGNFSDCLILALHSSQKYSFAASFSLAALMIFQMVFSWRKFNRVKISYLLSSFSSRAPPANS
jgi:hypothetical protein